MDERRAETRRKQRKQQRYRRLTCLTVLALLLADCGVFKDEAGVLAFLNTLGYQKA